MSTNPNWAPARRFGCPSFPNGLGVGNVHVIPHGNEVATVTGVTYVTYYVVS